MKLHNMRGSIVVLILSVTILFFACASKNTSSPSPAIVTTSVAKSPRIKEEALPEYPYLSQSEMVFYVSNTLIIESLSRRLGLAPTLFLSLVEKAHASFSKREAMVVLQINDITFTRKKKLLESIHADSLDTNERYWRHEDERGQASYFDIGYQNAVVVASFNPLSDDTPVWGWVPSEYIVAQQNEDLDAWFWSKRLKNVQEYEVEGFKIHALGIIVLNYPSSVNADIKTTFMFEYSGEKSARTTLRLLIPRLLESIDTSVNFSSLPNVEFVDNVLLLEGLIVSSRVFWKHVDTVINTVEEE